MLTSEQRKEALRLALKLRKHRIEGPSDGAISQPLVDVALAEIRCNEFLYDVADGPLLKRRVVDVARLEAALVLLSETLLFVVDASLADDERT